MRTGRNTFDSIMTWKFNIRNLTSSLVVLAQFLLSSCLGWGDIFAKHERIVGSYFLSETEAGYYQLYRDNIGRSPAWMNIIEYGVLDSLLIYKAQGKDSLVIIGGINMKKDNEIAIDSVFNLNEELIELTYNELKQKALLVKVKLPHSDN